MPAMCNLDGSHIERDGRADLVGEAARPQGDASILRRALKKAGTSMGIFDSLTQMVSGGGQSAQAAGGLVQEMQQRPGGLGGLLSMLHQNGASGATQQWAQGNTQPADQGQVEQGLGGGLIDSIAQRTGMSPTAVKAGLAVALPLIVHHMAENGHATADGQPTGTSPEPGGMLQSILARL